MIDWNSFNIWEFIPFAIFALIIIFVPTVLLPFFRFFSKMIIKPKKEEVPDWTKAPDWAKYLAQNIDGIWKWHNKKPVLDANDGKWYSTSLESLNYAGYTPPKGEEYKKSVQAKPKSA